jgi:hypothetical protein
MAKMFCILTFDIHLTFAGLREAASAKAGILALELLASNSGIVILRLEEYE